MKKQITRISPVQTGKVMALLYFLMSLPMVLFMFIAYSHAPGPSPFMGGTLFLMPVFYLVFGFVFTVVGAWVYNLVARWVGGIEFTTSEAEGA